MVDGTNNNNKETETLMVKGTGEVATLTAVDGRNTKKNEDREMSISQPQIVLQQEEGTTSGERSTQLDPLNQKKRPKGRDRALMETATGKKVLSSDIRLHLEKLKRQRNENEEKEINLQELDEQSEDPLTSTTPDTEEVDNEDEELQVLERELRLLVEKIRRKRENMRLQHGFSEVSEG